MGQGTLFPLVYRDISLKNRIAKKEASEPFPNASCLTGFSIAIPP